MKWLTNLKAKVASLKRERNPNIQFVKDNVDILATVIDNWDSIEFMIRYRIVFQEVIKAVSGNELEILNNDTPCKFREESDTPFRVECKANIDGESEKKFKQCEECRIRQG